MLETAEEWPMWQEQERARGQAVGGGFDKPEARSLRALQTMVEDHRLYYGCGGRL